MILYFDSYITDIPLPGRSRNLLKEDIRKKCDAYKMPSREEIAKYTLASYSLYPWSFVLIRYKLDNTRKYVKFDKYIKSLFPKAKIIHKRSDNQSEYKRSLRILNNVNDNWIFYAPNNDHPIISYDNNISTYIDELIKVAEKWKKKYEYVSIMYSHLSEFLNIPVKGTPEHYLHGENTVLLADTKIARTYLMPQGEYASVQIVHKNLFKHWFNSLNLRGIRIIRAEDIMNYIKVNNHIIIVPKREICAHFDGYEHMLKCINEIQSDQIPPLFIPKGFFENKIKIAYGFRSYRKEWVNINPLAKKYSFRDGKYGTDLKLQLSKLPAFWHNHVMKIDINSSLDTGAVKDVDRFLTSVHDNPWRLETQGMSLTTVTFWLRYEYFKLYIRCRKKLSMLRKYSNSL